MKDDLIEGEELEILSTDDAQVLSCERGYGDPKLSRVEIHSYRELPYTRFTAVEVDALIGALEDLRRQDAIILNVDWPCPMCGEMAKWYKGMSPRQRLCKTTDCQMVTFTEAK